jgi:activator of HSP90 ATPase
MKESLKVSAVFPVTAKDLYNAWLNSDAHTSFTGSPAEIDPHSGGRFSAWEKYISGTTIQLQPYTRIVQSWRTTEFPEACEDSNLEILFEKTDGGTRIILIHTNIPTGQAKGYEQGWEDFYFKPMKKYFNKIKA